MNELRNHVQEQDIYKEIIKKKKDEQMNLRKI
jgi:hypothetical protein